MEVAKDEDMMPCRARVALKSFLEPALASLPKGHWILGDFVTSPFPEPPVLQERNCPCPRATTMPSLLFLHISENLSRMGVKEAGRDPILFFRTEIFKVIPNSAQFLHEQLWAREIHSVGKPSC